MDASTFTLQEEPNPVFAATYPNRRHAAPREDALAWDEAAAIFVAADGVTRDWSDLRSGREPYPDPSPATDAAEAVAEALLQSLADVDTHNLRAAFGSASEAVLGVNRRWGFWGNTDYLRRDLAGAVAAVAVVDGVTLCVGWLGDCGVAVIRDADVACLTRDHLEDVHAYLAANPAPLDDERLAFVRRELRNRPGFRPGGVAATYGVLTGEPEALSYVETMEIRLRPGDTVVVHTDGFRPWFGEPAFLHAIAGPESGWEAALNGLAIRDGAGLGRERSLILWRYRG